MQKAVYRGHLDIVKVLRNAGAALHLSSVAIAVELCQLAAANDLRLMRCWQAAGVELSVADYDGRTPLHVVRAF